MMFYVNHSDIERMGVQMSGHNASGAALTARTWTEAGLDGEVVSALIKMFVREPNFRSAAARELLDETGGHRRPLRPEDFEWLALVPSNAHNQSALCALACQRVLA